MSRSLAPEYCSYFYTICSKKACIAHLWLQSITFHKKKSRWNENNIGLILYVRKLKVESQDFSALWPRFYFFLFLASSTHWLAWSQSNERTGRREWARLVCIGENSPTVRKFVSLTSSRRGGGLLPEYFNTIITPFSTLYEENRSSIAPKFEPLS